jgi:hypothetical protein
MVEGLALSARLANRNRKNRQKIEKSTKIEKGIDKSELKKLGFASEEVTPQK